MAQTAITAQEPQVILEIEERRVGFLLDTGAGLSVLLYNPGLPSSHSTTMVGVSGKTLTQYFSQSLSCSWGDLLFTLAFLIMPESSTPLLGRDILARMGPESSWPQDKLCLPSVKANINPEVWATRGRIGQAKTARPVQIHLKNPTSFPNQRQCPLKPEAREGLEAIIKT